MTATPMMDSNPTPAPQDVGVRKAGADDADRLVAVLCRAFDEDPVVNWFVRQDAARADAFRRFFDLAVRRLTLPYGEVYTNVDGGGAALWNPPGTWQLEPDDLEALLPDFAEVFGEDKLERSLHGLELMEARHPTEPHFYLFLLGVDPAWHNRGIGSALLQWVLRRCDEQGLPAYLEATSPRNVPLYERHGFALTETLHLPDGGPPVWLMWRTPRRVNRPPAPGSPAEMYQQFFGPALFAPWASVLVDRAAPQPGERVLDLACGTGIVTRQVAPAVGPGGRVVGVDLSPDMLAVARRLPTPGGASIEWREGDAVALDLPDGAFDLVLCQQGLQFFADRPAAAREMRRVLVDGGRAVLNVWQGIEHHPLLAASTAAVARHLAVPAADLDTPFSFGDAEELRRLLEDAGFARLELTTQTMDAHFPSAETFMAMTTVAAAAVLPAYAHVVADPASRAALVQVSTDASSDLIERYRDGDGLTFPWTANIAVAHP